ncbi:hypothetical protein GGH12_006048, partial [Coemansia sp. RSA 1822]
MYKFDKRCFALCKACRVDDKVESIDRFVNKGMATLVDEGTEIYTNNKSPFDNEMDDFVFAGDSGPRPIEAKLKWMVQVATHRWNRVAQISQFTRQVAKIRGIINDLCGMVYCLSK